MYLKSLELTNFRKFRSKNNLVEFVDSDSYKRHEENKTIEVASTTTLIVGKNNSGKTTVTTALEKLIKEGPFTANDFNFSYLREKISDYKKASYTPDFSNELPLLEFKLTIGIGEESNDLVTNLVPFMKLTDVDNSEVNIIIKYELEEDQIFQKSVTELLDEGILDKTILFKKFVELINDSTDFKIKYYNESGLNIPFKIKDLIEIKAIKANNVENDKSLSKAFSKIVEYRYKSTLGKDDKKNLESLISEVNTQLSTNIADKHSQSINDSLASIEASDRLEMLLSADITFQKLMGNLIKYEYVEQGHNIPENQFGLGYTNLMMIIADLIEYMEQYPEDSFNSKVNLISIEEPETFMHPQMQERFITHINDAISSLLEGKNKNVNSQLIITTHSSHILNSKIHSGNSFNNINYISTENNCSHIVSLNDDKISPSLNSDNENALEEREAQEASLKFLKKHIKYKVSELFFSDAIIFVEGVTEETLLKYYIETDEILNKYYISIFNIDGAHGLVYHNLIRQLRVPSLIITDLDIKRNEDEKTAFTQMTSLKDLFTTNETIAKYFKRDYSLQGIPEKIEKDNVRINYQGIINGFYATSFEEAFILTNFENGILKKTIESLKPGILKGIIGDEKDYSKLKENSYKLQKKLSSSKSDFANKLLFEFITKDESVELPELPHYIKDGLNWLSEKLTGGVK